MTTQPHSHTHAHAPDHPHPHADVDEKHGAVTRIHHLAMFLEAHFGEVELHMPEMTPEHEQAEGDQEPSLLVRLDEADAVINLLTMVGLSLTIAVLFALGLNNDSIDGDEQQ